MSHRTMMSLPTLLVALLLSLVFASVAGVLDPSVSLDGEQQLALLDQSTPPVIQCIRAPCGPTEAAQMDELEHFAEQMQRLQEQQAEQARERSSTQLYSEYELHNQQMERQRQIELQPAQPRVAQQDSFESHQAQMERQREIEVQNVRNQRMGQLQRQRQEAATNELPPLPASATEHRNSGMDDEMEAMANLLVMLDAVVAAEQEDGPAECGMRDPNSEVETAHSSAGEVEEEVVVVVAGDRWGHTMLIELHRQIYHADDSPCSHFPSPAEQQQREEQLEALIHPHASGPQQQVPMEQEASRAAPVYLYPRAVQVAAPIIAVVAFIFALTGACVVRKRRQPSVVVQPPTVQQLGLDVPMLSSSPSAGQVLLL